LLAAALLAQRLHAPNLRIRHGLRIERGHELSPSAWTEERASRSHEVIEYLEAHDAILDVANRSSPMRFCDVFFVGGMQIDREGSANLVGMRAKDGRMSIRGPGSTATTSIGTRAGHVRLCSARPSTRLR